MFPLAQLDFVDLFSWQTVAYVQLCRCRLCVTTDKRTCYAMFGMHKACLRRTAPCVFNTAVLFTFPFFLLYSIGIFQYFLRFSTNIFCVIVVHINNKQRVESTVDPYSHNFDGLSTSAAHKESAIMSFVFLLDQTNSSNIRNNRDESL